MAKTTFLVAALLAASLAFADCEGERAARDQAHRELKFADLAHCDNVTWMTMFDIWSRAQSTWMNCVLHHQAEWQ
jgi:hypothetical protein